jgi:tetratricopeptide (TPR) repeat protein
MRFVFMFIVMVFLSSIGTAHASGSQSFESGLKAFAAKQYQQAIRHFEQAETQGYNRYVIAYNLGVSHYKLGQYQQADRAFHRALASPKLKQVVQYNLGLVRLQQKQKREAIEWFEKAAAGTSNPKIAAIAEQMLGKYQTRKKQKKKNYLDGGIIVAYGHDDNVTQAATGTPSERSDDILETYAYLNILFKHADLGLNFYSQDFDKINSNDFTQLGINTKFPFKLNKWRMTPSLHYAESELDKDDYQSVRDLRLDAKRFIGKGDYLRFRYRFSDIASEDSRYNYLEGSRQQLRADYYTITRLGRFRYRYEYEVNDRQNSATRNYSPTRHSLRIQLKNSLPAKLLMKNEVLARDSQYDEHTDGFVRKDYRYQYRLHLYTMPFKKFETGVRFTYTDNNSNIPTESFIRRVTQAYLNYYF